MGDDGPNTLSPTAVARHADELKARVAELEGEVARLRTENTRLDAQHREYLAAWGTVTDARLALLKRFEEGVDRVLEGAGKK